VDPLLPAPGSLPAAMPWSMAGHCGAPLVATRRGEPVAVGSCAHWAAEPGSLDLSWGAARRFQLSAAVAGPDVACGLDELLTRWRDHLAGVQGTGDDDTAAVVHWPSRDSGGIATLLSHGLDPLEVLAARSAPRRGPEKSHSVIPNGPVLRPAPSPLIRQAGPADIEVIARLGLGIIRFDSRFGAVNERPDTLDALRREAAGALAGPDPWTWLAERDGEAVGMLSAQRPGAAGWISPMAGPAPAAYLTLMFVEPGERGGGVGTALADRFCAEADAAGVAVSLLHYAQLNPLSMPFWSRQGYRPLWTTWQATPARAVR
jgi:GNAT superfamily N-acetyltransferase